MTSTTATSVTHDIPKLLRPAIWARHERAILAVIILIGLALRLYGITLPLVDSHHQRQAQTAMVARNLYENGMNIFYPQYDIFGNSPGYAILEFPLLNTLTALLYFVFGVHEIIGRLIAVAFSIGAMFLMHRLARRLLPPGPALATMAAYALSPMNIYFSRAFMPESPMMFFIIGAVYFFLEWVDRPRTRTYVAAILFAAFAFLVKIPTLLILMPIACAWLVCHGRRGLLRIEFWAYNLGAVLPAGLWTVHASQVNAVSVHIWEPGSDIVRFMGDLSLRFSIHYYSFLFESAMFLLTPVGFLLFLAGIWAAKDHRKRHVLYAWLIAVLAYFFVLASAVSSHWYYSLPLLPPAALFVGFAVQSIVESDRLWEWLARRPRQYLVALGLSVIVAVHGAFYIALFADLYDVTKRVPYHLEVAQIIRQETNPSAVLILNDPPNALNTTLTYYAHRKSWPFSVAPGYQAIQDLESLRAQGATTYVAVDSRYGSGVADTRRNNEFWRYLNDYYTPIAVNEHYLIFDFLAARRPGE